MAAKGSTINYYSNTSLTFWSYDYDASKFPWRLLNDEQIQSAFERPVVQKNIAHAKGFWYATLYHNNVYPDRLFFRLMSTDFPKVFEPDRTAELWKEFMAYLPWLEWDSSAKRYNLRLTHLAEGLIDNLVGGNEEQVIDLYRGTYAVDADFSVLIKKLNSISTMDSQHSQDVRNFINKVLPATQSGKWQEILSMLSERIDSQWSKDDYRKLKEDLTNAFRQDFLTTKSGFAFFVATELDGAKQFAKMKNKMTMPSPLDKRLKESQPELATVIIMKYQMKARDLLKLAKEQRIFVSTEESYIEMAFPFNDSMYELMNNYSGSIPGI